MNKLESIKEFVTTQGDAIRDLAICWQIFAAAIEYQPFDQADLRELVEHLQREHDYIVDELGFEFLGGQLRVHFLDDKAFCSPSLMLSALQNVLQSMKS